MALSDAAAEPGLTPGLTWRREGQTVHGDARLDFPGSLGARHLHVTVDLGETPALLVRGALLVFLDVTVTLLFWLAGEGLLGRTEFLQRVRGVIRMRSYRLQLAGALAIFFVVPTVGFSAWMAGRLRADTVHSQDLVISQSLRDAMTSAPDDRDSTPVEPLDAVADRVGAELLVYRDGLLQLASAPAVKEMGLIDAYLPPAVYATLSEDEGRETMDDINIAGRPARTGFQAQSTARGIVLAMPHLPDEQSLMGESDLAYALLLVTLIGLAAAAALARSAARTLAQPVGALRTAAETVGRGETPAPFGSEVPEEFVPVAEAFTRMAADVRASQAALESARRRTVAVLRNVATGVVALDRDLGVSLANPRAEELLDQKLEPSVALGSDDRADWFPVWQWVRGFLVSNADLSGEEFTVNGRRIRVQASSLGTDGGCVVALDDVTELTHAVRVLAWGEIARQVAHEIKNPLTPMRLGIQHLRRVRGEGKGDFDQMLERTSAQILTEIDRLDSVARAFSRFGAPPAAEQAGPLSVIDLVAVARETAALYALGGDSGVVLKTDGVVRAMARPDELKEVLVNLVENARNAKATDIAVSIAEAGPGRAQIVIRDNGRGIRPEDLPRIFEPHFSTTTSGTGLGLAICRRLVASWGGTIAVQSTLGSGTTVTIELAAA
jgi:signal transduction histidine kinase